MLKMTKDDYLPDNGLDDCIKKGPKEYCFLAGKNPSSILHANTGYFLT